MSEPRDVAWIQLNGSRVELPQPGTLLQLLQATGTHPDTPGVAVAVNDRVVPRGSWAGFRLQAGDRVEVVRAVQGG